MLGSWLSSWSEGCLCRLYAPPFVVWSMSACWEIASLLVVLAVVLALGRTSVSGTGWTALSVPCGQCACSKWVCLVSLLPITAVV